MLTPSQKKSLLQLARGAVNAQVAGDPPPARPAASDLPAASGVFVTIKRGDELRGCLGTLESQGQLVDDVARCAADAASKDPRFERVTPRELPELSLEVSVLGPLESIDPGDAGAIVIGRHGLVAEHGHRRGLLLPQVATERGWTVEEFLQQTCLKAGLSADAWRRGARIWRFDAEVFGE
jgi:AmmeMemoRadiSam system protein A